MKSPNFTKASLLRRRTPRGAQLCSAPGGRVREVLEACGHEVLVANSSKVRLIYENDRKRDEVDAQWLARLARLEPSGNHASCLLTPNPNGQHTELTEACLAYARSSGPGCAALSRVDRDDAHPLPRRQVQHGPGL